MRKLFVLFLFCAVPLVFAGDINCLECHGKDGDVPINVEKFQHSVHSDLSCTDCHVGADKVKDGEAFEEIHPDNIAGKSPQCSDCHEEKVNSLKTSVHADVSCWDCHGNIHELDPENSIQNNKKAIPGICSDCHDDVVNEYLKSVHGKAIIDKNNMDAASCIDCHGDIHSVASLDSKKSPVYKLNVPETCGKCHGNEELMKKNNLRTKQYITYKHDFHGKMISFGNTKVATCSDCHTAHNILKSDDPNSTVNKKNVPKTCGQCHKGANEQYSIGKYHVSYKYKEDRIQWLYGLFFLILTVGTMVALLIHMFLDARARIREKKQHQKK